MDLFLFYKMCFFLPKKVYFQLKQLCLHFALFFYLFIFVVFFNHPLTSLFFLKIALLSGLKELEILLHNISGTLLKLLVHACATKNMHLARLFSKIVHNIKPLLVIKHVTKLPFWETLSNIIEV